MIFFSYKKAKKKVSEQARAKFNSEGRRGKDFRKKDLKITF